MRVLQLEELPAQRQVDLGRVRRRRAGDLVARVVVLDHADVVRQGACFARIADVEVELEAVVGLGDVVDPTDVRAPGADVEPALVRVVEAALQCRLALRLGDAAEDVVRGDGQVGADGAVAGMGDACEGQCGKKGGGEKGLAHDELLSGFRVLTLIPKHGVCQQTEVIVKYEVIRMIGGRSRCFAALPHGFMHENGSVCTDLVHRAGP